MNIKRFLSFFLVSLMLLSALASCASETPQGGEETTGGDVTPVPVDSIYVDANAESSGDGSEASPYKTIAEAQEKIREMKAANTLPDGGISVVLAFALGKVVIRNKAGMRFILIISLRSVGPALGNSAR